MNVLTWKCPKCGIKEDTSEYVERLFHRHGEQLFALEPNKSSNSRNSNIQSEDLKKP